LEDQIVILGPLRRVVVIKHGDHIGQQGVPGEQGGSQAGYTHAEGPSSVRGHPEFRWSEETKRAVMKRIEERGNPKPVSEIDDPEFNFWIIPDGRVIEGIAAHSDLQEDLASNVEGAEFKDRGRLRFGEVGLAEMLAQGFIRVNYVQQSALDDLPVLALNGDPTVKNRAVQDAVSDVYWKIVLLRDREPKISYGWYEGTEFMDVGTHPYPGDAPGKRFGVAPVASVMGFRIDRHYGPGAHPGTGTEQEAHAGNGGASVSIPEDIRRKPFYHGVRSEIEAQSILAHGQILPGSTEQGRAQLAPVAGMSYATSDAEIALMHAIGGDMAGSDLPESMIEEDGRYGYIFEIDPDSLDSLQPDEDNIGEFVAEGKYDWLNSMARRVLTPNQMRNVIDGEYAHWAAAGKKLVQAMTPEQKWQLIRDGANIANQGGLGFTRVWAVDKTRSADFPNRLGHWNAVGAEKAERVERLFGALEVVQRHYGPGSHPGTGTEQEVHAGDGAVSVDEGGDAWRWERWLSEKYGEVKNVLTGTWIGPSGKALVDNGDHQATAMELLGKPSEADVPPAEYGMEHNQEWWDQSLNATDDVVNGGLIRYNVYGGSVHFDLPERIADVTNSQWKTMAVVTGLAAKKYGVWPMAQVTIGGPFVVGGKKLDPHLFYDRMGLDSEDLSRPFKQRNLSSDDNLLYQAEKASIAMAGSLTSQKEAQIFVDRIVTTRWWRVRSSIEAIQVRYQPSEWAEPDPASPAQQGIHLSRVGPLSPAGGLGRSRARVRRRALVHHPALHGRRSCEPAARQVQRVPCALRGSASLWTRPASRDGH
jgi:hypothetical protein